MGRVRVKKKEERERETIETGTNKITYFRIYFLFVTVLNEYNVLQHSNTTNRIAKGLLGMANFIHNFLSSLQF